MRLNPEKLHPSILGLLPHSDPQVGVGEKFESFTVQIAELPKSAHRNKTISVQHCTLPEVKVSNIKSPTLQPGELFGCALAVGPTACREHAQ